MEVPMGFGDNVIGNCGSIKLFVCGCFVGLNVQANALGKRNRFQKYVPHCCSFKVPNEFPKWVPQKKNLFNQ
jgi:hypothetical protein